MEVTKPNENWNQPNYNIPVFKVDPLVVLLLSIVTCGIYLIYWNLKAAEVINAVNKREVVSPALAIISWCCGLSIFYFWVVGKFGLPKIYEYTNQPKKDDSILYLIIGFFFPMIAAMMVQTELNKLYN